jgi:2-amino-4-hydroxy-6-hydroxymethyldihydropteridine diphosphokinase
MDAPRTEIFVSAGSNIDPVKNLRLACRELESAFGEVVLSSVYQSPALGFEGDDFLNMVISFSTGESREHIIAALGRIEAAAGRQPGEERYSSRPLDLDLLLYGELVTDGPGIKLPRSDLTEYAFVLRPMTEIAPELRHPEAGKTMRELWDGFDRTGQPTEKLSGVYQPTLRPPSTAIT